MGTKEKLIERFRQQPKNLTFEETITLPSYSGYEKHNKGATSDSKIRFQNKEIQQYIDTHRPHHTSWSKNMPANLFGGK